MWCVNLLPENLSAILASKPLNKTALVKLKKTLEPFIQDSACPEIAPKLMKCRECKLTSNQRNKKIPNIFCRFYAFRRLRYNQKAILAIAGFSEPADADKDDIELWMPRLPGEHRAECMFGLVWSCFQSIVYL